LREFLHTQATSLIAVDFTLLNAAFLAPLAVEPPSELYTSSPWSLEARQAELKRKLTEPEVRQRCFTRVLRTLSREGDRPLPHAAGDERRLAAAREGIRRLIDEVSLEPEGNQVRIALKGNPGGNAATGPRKQKAVGNRRPLGPK
jgi:hypothetical protein